MNFSFFKKKPVTVTPNLSFIGVDMHSHLLPGIDDGLQTVEQTVDFVRELHQLGYKKLICTPHILYGVHNNSAATILPALALAKEAVAAAGIPVVIEAAAEYMLDENIENILKSGEQLMTLKDKYMLIEMSYLAPSQNANEVIFELQLKGITPILAHPERYNFYHKEFDKYENFKDRGVLLQVNLLSLSGYYGKEIKQIAERLIKEKFVDFIGTDMHHATHL